MDNQPLAIRVQPMPTKREGLPDVTEAACDYILQKDDTPITRLITTDLIRRNEVGIAKYGTPLQPFNGRDATLDAYQEACDLFKYLIQRRQERASVSFGSIDHCLQILIALRFELQREYGE